MKSSFVSHLKAITMETNTTKSRKSSPNKTESGLRKLFEHGLKDMYWVEKALTKALPKMIKNATSSELITALENHLAETEEHVDHLENVFEIIGKKPSAKKCVAMEGILKEGEEMMTEFEEPMTCDAAIIASAQKVEHYAISSYGTLSSLAETLGETQAVEVLETVLEQEKNADKTFSEIAETAINEKALAEHE